MADAGKARICLRTSLGGVGEVNVGEVHKPCLCRNEPARVVVERGKRFVEVDLDPLAPSLLRMVHGVADELGADASSLLVGANFRVDQEGVVTAVPRDVYEADERPIADARRYPAKAVRTDPVPPPSLGSSTVRQGERYELVVGRSAAPRELNI